MFLNHTDKGQLKCQNKNSQKKINGKKFKCKSPEYFTFAEFHEFLHEKNNKYQ